MRPGKNDFKLATLNWNVWSPNGLFRYTKNFKHDEHAEPRTPAAPRSHYNQVKRLGKITFMVLLLMPQRKRVLHTFSKKCATYIQKMTRRGSRPESRAPLKRYQTLAMPIRSISTVKEMAPREIEPGISEKSRWISLCR